MAEKKYIDSEVAIAVIEEKQKELCPVGMYSRHAVYGSDREKFDAWQEIIDTLEAIPAADARHVVRGKWIPVIRYMENTVVGWECSVCGFGIDISEDGFNYCPKCGADMRECET